MVPDAAVKLLSGRPQATSKPVPSERDRLRSLTRALMRELRLRGAASTLQRAAVVRAATMVLMAEQLRERVLAGDPKATAEDAVRLDNSAARALRDLRAVACKPKPVPSTLADYLRARQQAAPP